MISYPPLPTSPSVEAVDVWLKGLGLKSETVGSSYQNRDITMYEYGWSPDDVADNIGHLPTVLIISLVHGNEVMGLLALLQTIHNVVTLQQSNLLPQKPARILFIPFVNVDAYTLNIQNGQGYRRTNLRPTCQVADPDDVTNLYMGGVDLNRNHPTSWEQGLDEFSDCSDECGRNYHGPHAWSEPEAQAIRDVVLNNNVTAALSFHSRSYQSEVPLLIHPYTSNRFFSDMPARDRQRFLSWKQELNADKFYVAGTAQEAIHYTAGGSTIDWMYSVGVTSFVVEVVPPCSNDRWCSSLAADKIWPSIERYGTTGRQFIGLACDDFEAAARWQRGGSKLSAIVLISFLGIGLFLLLRHYRRRLSRRQDIEPETEQDSGAQVEMENLT